MNVSSYNILAQKGKGEEIRCQFIILARKG